MVNAGQLPLLKGHILTADDLVLRRHILNIMCTGHTSWNHHLQPCPSIFDGLERLQPLEEDGFVTVDARGLQVTTEGMHFLRNICMALDARLHEHLPATRLFSMGGLVEF